jgi:hypothetical protein
MIFTPLRYYVYKFFSSRILKGKPHYYRNLLRYETLTDLKQRIKESHTLANKVVADLSNHQLSECEHIDTVFNKFGKPDYLKSQNSGGIIHDVVLYKRLINGLQSKIIYNFINQRIASVSYTIQIITKNDEQKVDTFLKESSVAGNYKQVKARTGKAIQKTTGHKPSEISLTFINHNPEMIQNINAAVYIDKYTHSTTKYLDSSRFQLTV